ncbi:ABC transporter ATP-binding protein [Bifidobacterium sp.]|uniref:ABC transporter ATP-binding protein n=1 Tax=Bifidobacterium sp. TaxID=41200 RepID=UPI0025B7B480|nr:ATP-binding cassette domain-containing protein [Bifidobacterium sp.]MCH4209714.1 ATP-binding cassette domain-containing protein [Bifidobacterium sp.]MCI1224516.1 ATP-binding cassette domain-containing protein [Bifidobacterium sp.]
MNEHETVLKVTGLKKTFMKKGFLGLGHRAAVQAVKSVDFSIGRGKTFGIVGESGSGKSTIARLVDQLIEPDEGEIVFDGQDITRRDKKAVRKGRSAMQMVFQNPYGTLDPRKPISYSLEEPFAIHKVPISGKERRQRIELMLDTVGLERGSLNRYPHQFSGGQLQRLNIARAIILRPKLVILDESVSALDVSVQAQILNLLNRLQREFGLTYLFISHDLNVVRYFCDDIAVMHFGQFVEVGPAAQIYANPQHDYTKALISAIPVDNPFESKAKYIYRDEKLQLMEE